MAETINDLYKTELVKRSGSCRSRQQLELVTLEWVHWFNNQRLMSPIDHILPAEAEEKCLSDLTVGQASKDEITLTTSTFPFPEAFTHNLWVSGEP